MELFGVPCFWIARIARSGLLDLTSANVHLRIRTDIATESRILGKNEEFQRSDHEASLSD